jgi:general secretion pathway protein K
MRHRLSDNMRRAVRHTRQRGVAVITALLLTTLAISIVASLFWQQQVEVRSMENQRLNLQTRWILRGALDWATLVLRQDAYDNSRYTALTHVWATPLAETRLDQYIERERVEGEVFDASLSGDIMDATSRYNLRNLESGNRINKAELEIFQRLLTNLRMNPALARTTANLVAASQPMIVAEGSVDPATGEETGGQERDPSEGGNPAPDTGVVVGPGGLPAGEGGGDGAPGQLETLPVSREGIGTPIKFLEVEDLLAVKGFTPEMLERLRPYVIVLPQRTPVNVNTASPEVLAAVIPNYSLSEANALLARRRNVPWDDIGKFKQEINRPTLGDEVSVKSDWFLVNSRIRLERAALNAQALIQRSTSSPLGGGIGGGVKVVWVRQN